MKRLLNTRNLTIALYILAAFLAGFVLGFSKGSDFGRINNTEVRNQMLDMKPYDASLPVRDLEYSDISPAGCTIKFNTDHKPKSEMDSEYLEDLSVEYTIYPSDMFTVTPVKYLTLDDHLYLAEMEIYPEGGTLMFRVIEGTLIDNRGSLWFYIDLPRPDGQTVLPPPYHQEDLFTMRETPSGAIDNGYSKIKDTLQVINGKLEQDIHIKLGRVRILITPDAQGKTSITFFHSEHANVGKRAQTVGLGIGQIPLEDWYEAKSQGISFQDFITTYRHRDDLP